MAFDLRRYQERALDAIDAAEREGVRRPLVVHPTGTGKTVTFSHAIKRRADRGRSLVMVHRDELAAWWDFSVYLDVDFIRHFPQFRDL